MFDRLPVLLQLPSKRRQSHLPHVVARRHMAPVAQQQLHLELQEELLGLLQRDVLDAARLALAALFLPLRAVLGVAALCSSLILRLLGK